MLFEELDWIISQPPPQPYINLNVRIDTQARTITNLHQPTDTGLQKCQFWLIQDVKHVVWELRN